MTVQTCAEEVDLTEYGFIKDDCVSVSLASKMTGKEKFKLWKSRCNKYCSCVQMVDIGSYNSCLHLCKYCYANYNEKSINNNIIKHNVNSSLLIGELLESDVVTVRKE